MARPTYFNVMADTDGGGPNVPTYLAGPRRAQPGPPPPSCTRWVAVDGSPWRNGNPTFPRDARNEGDPVEWRSLTSPPQGDAWLHGMVPDPAGKTGSCSHVRRRCV